MSAVLDRITVLKAELPWAEFCKKAGLSYEKTRKCFQRNALPDPVSLSKIAAFCRVDLQWLITGQKPDSQLNRLIAQNIKAYRTSKGWSLEQLAAQTRVSPQVLELYEQGECALSPDLIETLCQTLGLAPVRLFLTGTEKPSKSPALKVFQADTVGSGSPVSTEDFVAVPLTSSAIAAGHPIIQEENIEDYVLLHIRAAGKRANLVASRVDGNSMEPMLHSGDIVVIDRNDKNYVKNKFFAVYYEGGLTAKLLERKNNLLILRPINPNSEVQIIDLNEEDQPVVGRIIGAWKDL
ncbi:MAG: helix-turn-helix domain-containing protein [Nitrospinaceae bacterium]|nr:helix-turn-helix domain-containing protein [Nitrospinaceae bacterium]NIU94814.1 helix-turn-helix domain-containing protein [Nitrospinaceae bacterium]NIW57529.1 helix-turn-helix domain-containing protein [Nitrospinaceae bacterium]